MARILITDPFPIARNEDVGLGVVAITSFPAAAAFLQVPYLSLPLLAVDILRRCKGISPAPKAFARHALKKVISGSVHGADVAATAARIREILQTILRTGIDIDTMIEHGSPRVRELAIITRSYRDQLLLNNYIDSAELLWAAAKCELAQIPMFIYGHHRARIEELTFISAAAADGSTMFLPCGSDSIFAANREGAQTLVAKGWVIAESFREQDDNVGRRVAIGFTGGRCEEPDSIAFEYPNIEAEARGVLSSVKQLIVDGVDPYQIALVCRDTEMYASVLSDIAFEYGLAIRSGCSVRLGQTTFGGFIRLTLEAVINKFDFESAARMIMHPFGPKLPTGNWTTARVHRASSRAEWERLGVELSAFDWPEEQTLAGWTTDLRNTLNSFKVRQKTAACVRDLAAYETFFESLALAERLEGSRKLNFEQFAAVISEVLMEEFVPFSFNSDGIALFEPTTIVGAAFDHIFVLGMAEGVLPAPPVENPVVDFYERKLIGEYGINFEGAADVARWEALSFYFTMLACRKSISFSCPSTLENAEQLPSSFFERMGIKPQKAPLTPTNVSSFEERRIFCLNEISVGGNDPVLDKARANFNIELRRETSPTYDGYDGVINIPIDPGKRTWSASQLTVIGQCPFRWFSDKILRLEAVDEIELGMDYTKRGTFYHRVLEIAVGKAIAEDDVRAATLRYLEAAFAEVEADPEVDVPTQLHWELQRIEHLTVLRKAIESADFISDGSRIVALEVEFNTVWNGFPIKGYIDRVDETPNGLIAIDYKTSSSPPKGAKDEFGKLSIDVQIPLYSNVALKHLYPEGKLGDSIYFSLVKGKVLRKEKEDDHVKLGSLGDRIKKILAVGAFAVDPDTDEKACEYCDYALICRKGPRLERKTADR